MAQVLAINCGSSSLKVSLFSETFERLFDRKVGVSSISEIEHNLSKIFQEIDTSKVSHIGHRVVHGADLFRKTTKIDDKVITALQTLAPLDPLHADAALSGIKSSMQHFAKSVVQYAVFDTAFHSNMPVVAKRYAISSHHSIQRYGFHGISHGFLWSRYVEHTGKRQGKVITLHLGNGCSMAAIDAGRSIDTSMGFTPSEGLVMGTRAGDIDSSVISYLSEKEGKTANQITHELNFTSGLLGLSNSSSDMQHLLAAYDRDNACRLAVDLFCYRVKKYLGAYMAALGSVDAIIFSGGIGENAPKIRSNILQNMSWLHIALDEAANQKCYNLAPSQVFEISSSSSGIPLFIIATNENLAIAKEMATFF